MSEQKSYGPKRKASYKKKGWKVNKRSQVYRPLSAKRGDWTHKIRQVVTGSQLQNISSALTTHNGNASYVTQSTTAVGWAMAFSLSDLANVSSFTGLFDSYRITKVVVTLQPMQQLSLIANVVYSNVSAASAVPTPQGLIYTAVDYDDIVASSIAAIKEHEDCKVYSAAMGTPIVRTIYPRTIGGAFVSTSFTPQGYTENKNKWIDMGSTNIPHFGFKVGMDSAPAGYQASWAVTCVYDVELKHVR